MGLTWENVDFKNNKIKDNLLYTPERGVYISTTKSKKPRVVSVSASVMTLLSAYKEEHDALKEAYGDDWYDIGFCFVGEYGKRMHPDSITHWLKKFTKKHGLNHISPHMLRHTQASVLINQNVDIVTISKRLGHSNPTTTQKIYAHMIENSDESASEVVSDFFYDNKN